MRDEAVASQDQDPTTEPAPAGEAPAGKDADAGPSDASETIVSGSHAAGSAANTRPAEATPADHDAWEAEFAGLAGSGKSDVDASGTDRAGVDPVGTDPSGTAPDADTDPVTADRVTADPVTADPAPAGPATSEREPAESGGAASPLDRPARTAETASAAAAGEAGAAAAVPTAERAAAKGATTAGGHPSLAQRSTLPMRAASTMPNLSRYDRETGEPVDAAAQPGEPVTTSAQAPADPVTGPDKERTPESSADADTDSTETDRGPWYVSGAGNTDTEQDAEQEGASEEPLDEEALRRSEERVRAATPKPVLARILQVMIAVFFPVMLLAAAIRAVATPMFLWIEYYRPGFPSDSFGFSAEDRMTYGSYAVDYLLNFASPRYLGDLVTPDGDPLYLASEVSHMADVKAVLGIAFLSAVVMALLSIAGGIYLARRCPGGIRRALFAGAVATLALIVGLLVAAVLAWEQFFTQVHTIFFAQGNWTFRLDDTLIRLFPSQFWMDAGGAVAGIVLLASVLVLVFTWPTKRRRERSRLARETARRKYLESLDVL